MQSGFNIQFIVLMGPHSNGGVFEGIYLFLFISLRSGLDRLKLITKEYVVKLKLTKGNDTILQYVDYAWHDYEYEYAYNQKERYDI